MKKTLLSLLLAASAFATGPQILIRPVCCRFEGWKGIELSVPNVPYSAQTNFVLQYKTSLNSSNWLNVVRNPTFGPFVEDGTWFYYFWYATPTNSNTNQMFWRILDKSNSAF